MDCASQCGSSNQRGYMAFLHGSRGKGFSVELRLTGVQIYHLLYDIPKIISECLGKKREQHASEQVSERASEARLGDTWEASVSSLSPCGT